ncbi:unnamed protein product [Moneuplotes crassus]|uniref:Uncharacterized protein n=1 Tax=Euplotes crassus TaxID=5936 RepID=A0AAD2D512_EUPCR|nr:unnamed protein product [Moneuplotes crassus]
MGYKETLIKSFIQGSLDYLSSFDSLDYSACEEKVAHLLCEADFIESVATQIETSQLIEELDIKRNQDLIERLKCEIEEAKNVIIQKEKEYEDALKVKACKEEYEQIATDINSFPSVEEIEQKTNDLNKNIQNIADKLEEELTAQKEHLGSLILLLNDLSGTSATDIINAPEEAMT